MNAERAERPAGWEAAAARTRTLVSLAKISALISAMAKERIENWHKYLPAVAFAYRSAVVRGMGYSPFFLMHGREPVIPGQLVTEDRVRGPAQTSEYVKELRERFQVAFEQVIRNDTEEKRRGGF